MMARMASPSPAKPEPDPPVTPAMRLQILGIEHSGLVASRTSTQSELLTRITIFLTLVSATLVSVALVGQVTGFGDGFGVFAIAVLAIAIGIGVLTHIRVINASMEDMMFVLALNRLRAEFARLAPGIDEAFMSSSRDDMSGVQGTYYFLGRRGSSHVIGSTVALITVVNAALVGLLGATIVLLATGPFPVASVTLAVVVGGAAALVYAALVLTLSYRNYAGFWKGYTPTNPTPD
jgi:hypothetical protein